MNQQFTLEEIILLQDAIYIQFKHFKYIKENLFEYFGIGDMESIEEEIKSYKKLKLKLSLMIKEYENE